MYLTKYLFLSLTTICILTFSCNKDSADFQNDLAETELNVDNISYKSDCRSFESNKSVQEILTDKEDVHNHKINMILFHYGQAIAKVIEDDELLCFMTDEMLADENGYGVSISKLTSSNQNFKNNINSLLKSSIQKNSIYPANVEEVESLSKSVTWDANFYLRDNFKYKNDQYEPNICFIKAPKYCDTNTRINVLIAEEANECDEVVGWSNGKKIFMSEKEVMDSEDINIFVGVGEVEEQKIKHSKIINKTLNSENIKNMKVIADIDIDVDEHKIKAGYRYERSKKSEIRAWCLQYFLSDVSGDDVELNKWEDFDPRDIHKNDIKDSKNFTSDLDAFDMSTTNFDNGKKVFIGAWENDWYSVPPKLIANPNSNAVAHSVATKRKFSHEWYFFDSDDLNDWFPNNYNTEIFENSKCRFKLKRKN